MPCRRSVGYASGRLRAFVGGGDPSDLREAFRSSRHGSGIPAGCCAGVRPGCLEGARLRREERPRLDTPGAAGSTVEASWECRAEGHARHRSGCRGRNTRRAAVPGAGLRAVPTRQGQREPPPRHRWRSSFSIPLAKVNSQVQFFVSDTEARLLSPKARDYPPAADSATVSQMRLPSSYSEISPVCRSYSHAWIARSPDCSRSTTHE